MKLHQCVNYLINRSQHMVTQVFKNHLVHLDITPVQYSILKCLWEENGLPPKQFSLRLGLDSPAITGVLDRLENKGLIVRRPDSNDRRALQVFLTEKSAMLEAPLNRVVEEADCFVLRNFSEDEIDRLKDILSRLFREAA